MSRLEVFYNNENFDSDLNIKILEEKTKIIKNLKAILNKKNIELHDEYNDYDKVASDLLRDIRLSGGDNFTYYMIGLASSRIAVAKSLSDNKKSGKYRTPIK